VSPSGNGPARDTVWAQRVIFYNDVLMAEGRLSSATHPHIIRQWCVNTHEILGLSHVCVCVCVWAFVRNELFRNICMEFHGGCVLSTTSLSCSLSISLSLLAGQPIRATDSLSLIIKRTKIYFTDIKVLFQVLCALPAPTNELAFFFDKTAPSIQITPRRVRPADNISNCTLLL